MHAVHSPWRGVEISSFSSPHVNMSISNHSTTRKSWRSDAPIILPGWECHTGGSRSKPTVHRCRPKTGGCGLLTRTQDEPTKQQMSNIAVKYVVSAHARVCYVCARPSLLRLLTARDAAGSRQIGGAEMEEHRKVSGLISGSKAKRCIVKLVAAM